MPVRKGDLAFAFKLMAVGFFFLAVLIWLCKKVEDPNAYWKITQGDKVWIETTKPEYYSSSIQLDSGVTIYGTFTVEELTNESTDQP